MASFCCDVVKSLLTLHWMWRILLIRSCCPPALADELNWLYWVVYKNS